MKIQNPILRGFNPDPSLLHVGQDYYLATSTFEWWPGIEIYHSQDLVNWDLVCEPLNDEAANPLRGVYNSGGIWAPHLSYADGQYWLVGTIIRSATAFKDTLNFVMTSDQIESPWSKPIFLTASGFDPSLFHDDDGRHYILNMLYDNRLDEPGFSGIALQEFDPLTMKVLDERKKIYNGTNLGTCEGPQIMKKDGWYYLLCAAGGTGYSHAATVARSRDIWGPYENSPIMPLISTRYTPYAPLKKCGHACFCKVSDDEWYIVFLCARPLLPVGRSTCPLGRETGLAPIEWTAEGWPRLKNGTAVPDLEIDAPSIAHTPQRLDYSQALDFGQLTKLPPELKTLRGPLGDTASLTERPGYLRLHGRESLSSLYHQTLLARRWQAFHFTASTEMTFAPTNFQQTAGLILFYDTENWAYLYCSYDERQKQTFLQVETATMNSFRYLSKPVAIDPAQPVQLQVMVDRNIALFSYQQGENGGVLGETYAADRLSDDYVGDHGHLGFTGAMVGLCAQDMDAHRSYADFKYFNYDEDHQG
ncbi:glycoside hydrolase family 43 protein [Schleiferilactobacillus harbinensis]|uniref:glycoside hydrolase family 43 protein n=1 Tax=Schleiferilactobacillus harbinensis TaxID=304207 RepID=UPI00123974AF|nr:glycoside hydrolase family 43 protein [Schleiferilactobacillus harbinensis]QEU47606.1 glycoside hydrolase family 43 protein [Schleiferilactobacillus harbinensis]